MKTDEHNLLRGIALIACLILTPVPSSATARQDNPEPVGSSVANEPATGDAEPALDLPARVNRLLQQADAATDAEEKVAAHVGAATLLIGEGSAALFRDWLVEGRVEPVSVDASEVFLKQASTQIELVKAMRDEREAGDPIVQRVRKLEVVRDAVRALFSNEEDHLRQKRLAASSVAVWLEEDDPAVSRAAALWYASLRSGEKDSEPAMSVLQHALAPRNSNGFVFDFFGRILRCRLLAESGSPSAAIVLLMQMEELCEDWFTREGDREAARLTLLAAQRAVYRAWQGRLEASTAESERAFIQTRLDRMDLKLANSPSLLALPQVFPLSGK